MVFLWKSVPCRREVGITFITASSCIILARKIYSYSQRRKNLYAIKCFNDERDKQFSVMRDLESKIPAETIRKIGAYTSEELCRKLQSRELSAVDVLRVYQIKAMKAQDACNCVFEFIMEAEEVAFALDKAESPVGPLHGIPISIKESFAIAGHYHTGGCPYRLRLSSAEEDCPLVKGLRKLGAIPFVRTTVPQTLMALTTCNPITGLTTHPTHPDFSAGGSSGGEGALHGLMGSVFGIGSDIGGSIRCPSAYCGIYGLKTSSARVSSRLTYNSPCVSYVKCTVGPMASSLENLVFGARHLFSTVVHESDKAIVPLTFNDTIYDDTKPLRVGYFEVNDVEWCAPVYRHAVRECVEKLRNAGHMVFPFQFSGNSDLCRFLLTSFFADGGAVLQKDLAYSPRSSCVKIWHVLFSIPPLVRRFLSVVIGLTGSGLADMLRYSLPLNSVSDFWDLGLEIDERKNQVLDEMKSLDVILCPPCSTTSLLNSYIDSMTSGFTYLQPANVYDLPVGVFPVSTVTPADVQEMQESKKLKQDDVVIRESFQSNAVGLPVCLQFVGAPFKEEIVLRAMRTLLQLL